MSGKSSSLRVTASASGPSPTIKRRSGGVTLRQMARAPPRKEKPSTRTELQTRSRSSESRESPGNGAESPDDDPRELLDREVPHRPVVAVVEADQLCGHDPNGGGEDEQECSVRPSSPQADDNRRRSDSERV